MNNFEHAQWQIERTIVAAQHAHDQGDLTAFAEHFKEDGKLYHPTSATPYCGRDAIVAVYKKQPTDRLNRHVISNILVTHFDENEASSISYVTLYSANKTETDKPELGWPIQGIFLGEYHDQWERKFDQWLLTERRILFTINISNGDVF